MSSTEEFIEEAFKVKTERDQLKSRVEDALMLIRQPDHKTDILNQLEAILSRPYY